MKTSVRAAVLLLFVFSFAVPTFAKITLESVKGSLLITGPDGNVKLVDEGDKIPDIDDQSTIEVFNGEFTAITGPNEKVKFACGGNEGETGGGSKVGLSCGETGGLLKVVEGAAHVKEITGNELDVAAGNEHILKMAPLTTAAPVGAPQDNLGSPAPSPTEPDSRGIELGATDTRNSQASVSQ